METPEKFEFPFQPYSIQHDFMRSLYEVIENRKLGIFESPTGTGKSLSIICGAIRWLKDHNSHVRQQLKNQISELENEKAKISSDSADWISIQSKEIELTRKINELKLQENKINDYDEKIESFKKKKSDIQKKRLLKKEIIIDKEPTDDDDIILEVGDEDEEADCDEETENRYKPTKIFICSRTHSQLSQFIGEILKSPFGKALRVASLASRQTYCINPEVSKLKNNSLINERCLDKQKKMSKAKTDSSGKPIKRQKLSDNSKCPFYKQTAIEDLKNLTLGEVQDVEDLLKNGKQLNACPYYSSRLAAEDAEIVLVPYNTILHKATREANGIDLKDNVIIIDEAHNLLEAMAQMHNSEVTYNQLDQGLLQVKCYKQRFHTRFSSTNLLSINQLIFVLTKLQQLFETKDGIKTDTFTVENFVVSAKIDNFNMFRLLKFCKNSRIAQKVRTYALKFPFDKTIIEKPAKKGVKDFLSKIKNKNQTLVEETVDVCPFSSNNPLLSIISFLEALTYSYTDGRIFLHNHQDKSKSKLQFLLLNPSQNFQDIVKFARCVIVAGGTMKPNDEFKNRLFINSGASPDRIVEFSCDHIISHQNILPIILTEGPNREKLLFNFEQRMLMGDILKQILQDTCKTVSGGIVVFFPSYNYESWIWQQIKDFSFGRAVFREPQDSSAVEAVLKSYSDVIRKTGKALLLSVVGGKLSEGLNFSDDLGRCVIVVGLPYANVTAPDLKEKMNYLDKTEGSGAGKRFYEALCMKAVNQSIGRAVRHKDDYATILLLDERYNRLSTKDALPNWIKKSLKVYGYNEAFINIQKFFQNKKY